MSNIFAIEIVSPWQSLIAHCNTPERIKVCCRENNAFKPEMFDQSHDDYIDGLIAVKIGEQVYNKQRSKYQVRPDTTNKAKIKQFAAQANNGVRNERGQLEYGVRVPLNVIPRNDLNYRKHIVEGIGGFNREAMFELTNLTHFPAILDKHFLTLETRYEQNRYLRRLNSHPDNGEPNSEEAIKNGIAAALTAGSGVLQDEIATVNMINRKLEDQTLETPEVRSLVNQRGRVKTKIIDFLLSDVIEDSGSRWSEDYARKQISNVIKNWCLSENKAIYIYPDTAMPIIEEREKSKVDASEFIIKRHSGKASGTKRQLCGDLWNLIVNHKEKYGKNPTEVMVLVALTGAGRVKKLHESRVAFYNYVSRLISDAYPEITVNFQFLGQAQTDGQVEEVGELYGIEHIKRNLKKLVDNRQPV